MKLSVEFPSVAYREGSEGVVRLARAIEQLEIARDLERLFSRLDPDWEGRLSLLLGDVWGHQVAAGIRAGAEQARESAGNAGEMISEFLDSAESPVAREDELSQFAEAVDETREAVEELEARVRQLLANRA